MTQALEDWTRAYLAGDGGRPFLFYVVFGSDVSALELSQSVYRCDAVPEGIEIMAYGADRHPEVFDDFRRGWAWEELARDQPDLAAMVRSQTRCVVVRGEAADAGTLNYFRNAIGLVTAMLDAGGVAIYDLPILKWWSPEEWREDVFDADGPSPRTHVVILVSEEDDGSEWMHTRGMRKFGRPDLSVHHFPPQHRDPDFNNEHVEICWPSG